MTEINVELPDPVFSSLSDLFEAGMSAKWTVRRTAGEVMEELGDPHATGRHIDRQVIITTRVWHLCPGAMLNVGSVSEKVQAAAVAIDQRFPGAADDTGFRLALQVAGFDCAEMPKNRVDHEEYVVWPDWDGFAVHFYPDRFKIFVYRPRPPGGGRKPDLLEVLKVA